MSRRAPARRFLVHALVALAAAAVPATARAAVSSTVSGNVLTITVDAADAVAVTCASGQVKVNGADPSPGPAASCASLLRVRVIASGSFANAIDLGGVTRALGFTGLDSSGVVLIDTTQANLLGMAIAVDAGPGDDDYLGSDDATLAESLVLGDGSDAVAAGAGSAYVLFRDAPAPEVDTLTVAGSGTDLRFGDVATPVTIDLNGGLGGDPLAIATHANRVVKRDPASTSLVAVIGGGKSGDTMTGHAASTTHFTGFEGTDVLTGGSATDTYTTGQVVNAGTAAVTISDPGGNDFYFFSSQPNAGGLTVTIDDDVGDNQLDFNSMPDAPVTIDLTGGLGGSVLAHSATNAVIVQGDAATAAAFRTIRGSDGSDDVTGNAKNNFFNDCGGNDVYRGGPGNDTFNEMYGFLRVPGSTEFVDCGNDRYEGGAGDDHYRIACRAAAGLETKTLVELPGEGTDHVEHRRTVCVAGTSLVLDLRSDGALATVAPSGGGPARQVVQTGAAGQAANFEDASGGSHTTMVFGNDADNRLSSTLTALVFGGPGNDTFLSGTVSFANAPGPVVVDMRVGTATGEGNDIFDDAISRVVGSPFGDVIIGPGIFGGTTMLDGAGGNDTLITSGGDTLNGGEGDDTLHVGGGTTASGGNGNDTFYARNFTGTLNGDAGDDTFVLNGGLRTVNGGTGMDTIDSRSERDDTINCGADADVVRGDEFDVFAADCESVNPGPAPGPPDTTGIALLTCGGSTSTFNGASADGTRVVFSTTESLSAADTDTAADLYLRDGSSLFLVSGGIANVAPSFDLISDDGTRVIFTTTEALPGTGDGDTQSDVYQWQNGVRTLLTPGTTDAVFRSGGTADASRLFFTTETPLVSADTDTEDDVYERSGGTYTLISAPGTGFTLFNLLSGDGTRIYFQTSKGLLPEDTDGVGDVYERSAGGLRLISGPSLPGALGVFTTVVGATPNGSHVYFSTDKRLVPEDTGGSLSSGFDLYVRTSGGLDLIGEPETNATFLATSADGSRFLFTTRTPLVPADMDESLDVYASDGGVLSVLSGGSEELDVRNVRAATDASKVVFETDESLLPADVDAVADVYEHSGGMLTLVTPGTAEIPAVFRDATADLATIIFRTAEPLVMTDTDPGIDVYKRTSGGVELVAAGTAKVTTIYRGSSDDGSVVFFDTSEVLRPADVDAITDLYVVGAGGYPADPVCTVVITEDCDNCIDDDGDMNVDREDADCPPYADGGGDGLDDPKLQGKPAVNCQKGLGKAGAKLVAAKLKRMQKCLAAVFACLQLKPGDQACITKATNACAKQFAGLAKERTKFAATAAKSCGPPKLQTADLQALAGLAFDDGEEAVCAEFDVATFTGVADVSACLRARHECRAEELAGQEFARARELFTLAGRTPETEFPCLPIGTDGSGMALGDPKTAGKGASKCQAALGKAGAKFVAQKQKLVQKCALAVAVCIQQKPTDPKCLPKAQAACDKAIAKLTAPGSGVEAKLASAITKPCGVATVGVSGVLATGGLGFQGHAEECAALGVTALVTLSDVIECVTRLHECRAEQLLEAQTPRLREQLDLGDAVLP